MAKKHRDDYTELEDEILELQERNQHLENKLDEKDQALKAALSKILMLEIAIKKEQQAREALQKSLL